MEVTDTKYHILYVRKDKVKLKGTNALKYIEYGEKEEVQIGRGKDKNTTVVGYNKIPALKDKGSKWYRHFTFYRMPILIPDFTWERMTAHWNKAQVVCVHSFYGVMPFDEKDTLTILGYLNSSFAAMYRELYGNTSLGEGVLRMTGHSI
jgi:hypothetical protein